MRKSDTPPDSYYDPPDPRHCPECERCHFHGDGECDAEYVPDRASPVYCCRECSDPADHKTCAYHVQRGREFDYDPVD